MSPVLLGIGASGGGSPQEYDVTVRINHRNDGVTRVGSYWGVWGDNLYWIGDSDMNTALRFTGLAIPQGATILDARLSLWRASTMPGATGNDYANIGVEQVGNPARLNNLAAHEAREDNIGSVVAAPLGAGSIDTQSTSPDLSAIIQPIINSTVLTESIMFFCTPNPSSDNSLEARSYETGTSLTWPQLYIKWEI